MDKNKEPTEAELIAENQRLHARLREIAEKLGVELPDEQPQPHTAKANTKMTISEIVAEGNHKVWCEACKTWVPERSTIFGSFSSLTPPAHYCKDHFANGLHGFREFKLYHERTLRDYEPEK